MALQTSGASCRSCMFLPHAAGTHCPTPRATRKITNDTYYSAVIPCLIGGGLNAYNLWNEHWEHWEHMPPLEERTEYPYQNIRSKNYPWRGGDKVSFCSPCCITPQEYLANSLPTQTLL